MNGLTRDVDLYLLGRSIRGVLSLHVDGGALAAFGPAEAVQKFVVALLTLRGSIQTDPDRGTYFWKQLTSGQLRTESDVTSALSIALHETLLYLAGVRAVSADLDEEIATASPLGVTLTVSTVNIALSLTTMAGTPLTVTLPFELE